MIIYPFTIFFIFLWVLKYIAIFNAIKWLYINGNNYKKYFAGISKSEEDKISEETFFQAFEKSGGDVLPFGIKDYKLRRFAKERKNFIYTFFQKWLFRFNRLIIITGIYLVISIFLTKYNYSFYLTQNEYILLFLSLLPLVGNIILAVESIYSYTFLGSYAVLFHMLSPKENKWNESSIKIVELKLLLSKVIAALLSGTIACYVGYVIFGAFNVGLVYENMNPLTWLRLIWQFFYFTTTTFLTVGYGDIIPKNELGQLIAFLIMIQGVMLIVVVFSSLTASGQISNEINDK